MPTTTSTWSSSIVESGHHFGLRNPSVNLIADRFDIQRPSSTESTPTFFSGPGELAVVPANLLRSEIEAEGIDLPVVDAKAVMSERRRR